MAAKDGRSLLVFHHPAKSKKQQKKQQKPTKPSKTNKTIKNPTKTNKKPSNIQQKPTNKHQKASKKPTKPSKTQQKPTTKKQQKPLEPIRRVCEVLLLRVESSTSSGTSCHRGHHWCATGRRDGAEPWESGEMDEVVKNRYMT